MRTCSNCTYYVQNWFNSGYCQFLEDAAGNCLDVNSNDSCDQFTPKSSPDNYGYKKGDSSSGCFLTTACVDFFGQEDDCPILTKLRWFRDEFLLQTESGKQLVDEYYAIAPQIVEKIDQSNNRAKYYEYIYKCIENCAILIDRKNYQEALSAYKEMVLYIKNEVL